jgi:hypothetical protein
MLFTVEKDGEEVSSSSPRSVRLLLDLGWRLADPSQRDRLVQELEAEALLLPREDGDRPSA